VNSWERGGAPRVPQCPRGTPVLSPGLVGEDDGGQGAFLGGEAGATGRGGWLVEDLSVKLCKPSLACAE